LFEFGEFNYEKVNQYSISLIKGKFNLSIKPLFTKEFEKTFWFYDLEDEQSLHINDEKSLISFGPYYPLNEINEEDRYSIQPALSNIILNSKSGPLYRAPNDFIVNSRKQQLEIISNFCASYLNKMNFSLNNDIIIPVPAKPMYSFNSIEIICQEFNKIFSIPIDLNIIERTSNDEKYYDIINKSINLSKLRILLIDDIITEGDTKDLICLRLNEIGCRNIDIITIGKTDHNLYD